MQLASTHSARLTRLRRQSDGELSSALRASRASSPLCLRRACFRTQAPATMRLCAFLPVVRSLIGLQSLCSLFEWVCNIVAPPIMLIHAACAKSSVTFIYGRIQICIRLRDQNASGSVCLIPCHTTSGTVTHPSTKSRSADYRSLPERTPAAVEETKLLPQAAFVNPVGLL